MTFVDGHKSTFRKVESIQAQREKEGYLFTFLGTSDELIDGKEPEDWNPIILQFGRALCPYGLQVTEQGELTGVHDFETVKKHGENEARKKRSDYRKGKAASLGSANPPPRMMASPFSSRMVR